MKEIWKDIIGYNDYKISNFGRVISKERKVRYVHAVTKLEGFRLTKERDLKVYLNNRTGYKFVQLYSNKKSKNFTIHRLVALHFLENKYFYKVVNHIDGNKMNNLFNNLEWCTNEYNHSHATMTNLKAKGSNIGTSKLDDSKVYAIKLLLHNKVNHKIIASAFKVSRSNITLINNEKIWKHIALTQKELEINL